MRPARWRRRRRSRRSARRSGSTGRGSSSSLRYFRDIAAGDLGRSLVTGQPVVRDLLERFPASFELTFVAMMLALVVSIPLGIVAAIRAGSWIDHLVRFIGTIGVSMPAFVAGIVLIYVLLLSSRRSRRSRSTASIPSCSSPRP